MNYSFPYTPYNVKFLNQDSLDPQALAYLTAAGITGATQQAAINNLVLGLKTDGTWSKMKAVYPFVTDNKNVLGYTEDFANSYWSKVNATVSSNSTIAPDGTNTADLLTSSAAFGRFRTTNGPRNEAATYAISCYIKGYNGIAAAGSIVANVGVGFTIASNGTVTVNAPIGLSSASNLQVQNVGNGWYRVSGIHTYTTSTDDFQIWSSNSGDSFYVWGAQLELGSTATTYQPIATTQQAFIANQFKYNLVNPLDTDAAFRLVFNGGWTHSSTGALPNGTNGYADTKLVPSTSFSSNNSSFGVYSRTNNINGENFMATATALSNRLLMFVRFTSGGNCQFNHNSQSSSTPTITNSSGYFASSRIAAGTHKIFVNGALNTTSSTFEQGFSTIPIYISSFNDNGTASGFSNRQLAFAHIGDGLTDTEAANLYSRVNTFQTALSRNV